MKKTITLSLMALALSFGQAQAAEDFNLEPCMNSQVSADGTYDVAVEAKLDSEPCINSEVE